MNEQQQQILEDRVSDALLAPLTDEQLAQLDKLMDNPAITEDQVEQFIRMAGVDIEGITRKVTEDFMKEQNIAPAQPAQPAQPVQPAPAAPQTPAQPVAQPAQPQPVVPPVAPGNNAQGVVA